MKLKLSDSEKQALAIAYINAQDNKGKTPAEFLKLYVDTIDKFDDEIEKLNANVSKPVQRVEC